jgi:hypothetical protein
VRSKKRHKTTRSSEWPPESIVEVYKQEKLGIVVQDSQIEICKALKGLHHLYPYLLSFT